MMPLNAGPLTSTLLGIMNGSTPVPTANAAGTAWGNAYDAFAKTGDAGGVPAVVPPAATTALRAALGSQFTIVPGSPGGAAAGIAAALDSYWPLVTFAGMIGPPAPTGGATLISDLTTIFSAVGGTHAGKTSQLVAALQDYTNQVFVVLPPATLTPVA